MIDTKVQPTSQAPLTAADHAVDVVSSALKNVENQLYEDWMHEVRLLKQQVQIKLGVEGQLTFNRPDFGREAMTLVATAIQKIALDLRNQ